MYEQAAYEKSPLQHDYVEVAHNEPVVVDKEEKKSEQISSSRLELREEISRKVKKEDTMYVPTKKCEDLATPLNFKKVDIQVLDGLVKEGGIFSASYPTYKIVTTASGI